MMKTMDKNAETKDYQERNESSKHHSCESSRHSCEAPKHSSHEDKEVRKDAYTSHSYHKMSLFASRTENGEQTDIRIRRETGKPTEITVSRGCDTWELLPSELIRLPEDLRDEVRELLLGPGAKEESESFLCFGMENDACD